MTTAFVLSGGGSLGAVQVGMLQALTDRRESPDLLVGTSVGALNAAFVAGHCTGHAALCELADSWASVQRRDIFPLQPLRHLLAVAGARRSLCSERGLRHLIAISQAVALGADRVFVLPTGYACALTEPPSHPIGVALQALSLLIQQRLISDVAFYADRVELIVLPPLCPLDVSPADFSQSPSLIERARSVAGSWLDGGNPSPRHPERLLSLHDHGAILERQPTSRPQRTRPASRIGPKLTRMPVPEGNVHDRPIGRTRVGRCVDLAR